MKVNYLVAKRVKENNLKYMDDDGSVIAGVILGLYNSTSTEPNKAGERVTNDGRVTDEKIPLSIDFKDGNSDNKSLQNMRLLCPNCYYVWNGFFHSSKTFCK